MMGRKHSMLAPSDAASWVKCHAKVQLCALYGIDDPSTESEEGTAAHWVLERKLTGQPVEEGDFAPNGIEVDDEMLEGAQVAIEYIQTLPGNAFFSGVEVALSMPRIRPEMFGTCDVAAYWRDRQVLEVIDYKFGWSVIEPESNWQLIAYVVGMLDKFQIHGLADQFLTVRMTIIQPRPYHKSGPVRTWEGKASDLRAHINQLTNAANAAMEGTPQYQIHENCENCSARHVCPKLAEEGWKSIDRADEYDPPLDAPLMAQSRELIALRRAIRILKARESGIETAMTAALRKGERLHGWEMSPQAGRLQWNDPPEIVEMTAAMMGINLHKPARLMTPTQAKALLPESVIEAMASRPVKMVLREIDMATLKRIFKK